MSRIMGAKNVNNCPDTVKFGDIIVVKVVDGKLWFYGNYKSDFNKAEEVAKEIDGIEMIAMEVEK